MDLIVIKVIALVALFGVTFGCCSIPFAMFKRFQGEINPDKRKLYKRILSFLSCFGGGVFLATCFLHLFSEAEHTLNKGLSHIKYNSDFPVGKFIVVFGFLLVLIIEQMVQAYKESGESESLLQHSHSHFTYGSEQPESGTSHNVSNNISPAILQENRNKKYSQRMQHSVHEDPSSHSSLRSAILVLALSLHAIFEGVAIGLETTKDDVISLLTAVLIHKSILAFTLGLNLVQSKLTSKIIMTCNFIFSVMAPIGMAVGIGVMKMVTGSSLSLASGSLQCIAAGTFIYVTFFEILPHELNSNVDRMLKLFWVIVGYSAFSFITYYMPS